VKQASIKKNFKGHKLYVKKKMIKFIRFRVYLNIKRMMISKKLCRCTKVQPFTQVQRNQNMKKLKMDFIKYLLTLIKFVFEVALFVTLNG
jgi:hypothetical protein